MRPDRPPLPAAEAPSEDLVSAIGRLEERFAEVEPGLLAFVPEDGRFARLRREAEDLLTRYPDPEGRPALFGVLLGVKDIFHAEGLPTRAGSRLPPDELAGPEAAVVAALKSAGALVLGKTVSTEFAYFAPGPTRNPQAPGHTPGGSSSGSAAAVAARLCRLALGTQTIGSISRPAAFCGVVGYKPTYDRISRQGVIPLAPSLDHVGLFAADVAWLELGAATLCRGWRRGVSGEARPVLGIPEGPYLDRAQPEGREDFRAACERLESAGYEVRSAPALADFAEIEARHYLIVAAEAAGVHQAWHERYGELYHEKTAELIRRGRKVTPDELEEALGGRERLRNELSRRMEAQGIELWISPAAPGAAPPGLESTGDPVMNLPWTHSGLPTLALPSGRNAEGLPFGLQVAARWEADEQLLAWGHEMEAALGFPR
ncbi:MAG: amidase [Thermoanaerobaculia bacterium]